MQQVPGPLSQNDIGRVPQSCLLLCTNKPPLSFGVCVLHLGEELCLSLFEPSLLHMARSDHVLEYLGPDDLLWRVNKTAVAVGTH